MTADDAVTTAITTEQQLWTVSPWSATVANQMQPGQVYRICAAGTCTLVSGTVTVTPRWQASGIAGTSFGASPAITVSANTNKAWYLDSLFVCRAVGTSGSGVWTGVLGAPQTAGAIPFGGAATTFDTTTAQGFGIDITVSVTTSLFTTRLVCVEALN